MIEKYSCAIPFKILRKSWISKIRDRSIVWIRMVVEWSCDSASDINPNNKAILPYNVCSKYFVHLWRVTFILLSLY